MRDKRGQSRLSAFCQRLNMGLYLSKERTQRCWLKCRNPNGTVASAKQLHLILRQTITLIEYEHTRNRVQAEILQNIHDGINLHIDVGRTSIDNLEQYVRLT